MNKELFDRFDAVMANLKPIEPSSRFDLEFRKRLESAVAKSYEESALERLARKTLDDIRYALAPQMFVFAQTAAIVVILVSIGMHLYFIQPSNPGSVSKEGLVMVQGPKDLGWKELTISGKLSVGDIVSTHKGGRLDISLTNKYAVRIKENTKIKIAGLTSRYGMGSVSFKLIEGEILVNIDEGFKGKGANFVVATNAAMAKAIGTKFAVDASMEGKSKTKVSVLEGSVKVESAYRPGKIMVAKQIVTVDAGQKTEVAIGQVPQPPQRLMAEEWQELEELYQIGRKPQVMLLIKNTPDRAMQLLKPCPIYISDEKPRQIPRLLEEAVMKTAEAIKTHDVSKHLDSIKILERIVRERPNSKYDVQLMLYIGAYYEYISHHQEAINTFEKVIQRYPNSPLASVAQCAVGIIYDDKLADKANAEKAYKAVLENYPNSLEAIWVEERLGIKKVRNNIKNT